MVKSISVRTRTWTSHQDHRRVCKFEVVALPHTNERKRKFEALSRLADDLGDMKDTEKEAKMDVKDLVDRVQTGCGPRSDKALPAQRHSHCTDLRSVHEPARRRAVARKTLVEQLAGEFVYSITCVVPVFPWRCPKTGMVFDYKALLEWVVQNDTQPVTKHPLTFKEVTQQHDGHDKRLHNLFETLMFQPELKDSDIGSAWKEFFEAREKATTVLNWAKGIGPPNGFYPAAAKFEPDLQAMATLVEVYGDPFGCLGYSEGKALEWADRALQAEDPAMHTYGFGCYAMALYHGVMYDKLFREYDTFTPETNPLLRTANFKDRQTHAWGWETMMSSAAHADIRRRRLPCTSAQRGRRRTTLRNTSTRRSSTASASTSRARQAAFSGRGSLRRRGGPCVSRRARGGSHSGAQGVLRRGGWQEHSRARAASVRGPSNSPRAQWKTRPRMRIATAQGGRHGASVPARDALQFGHEDQQPRLHHQALFHHAGHGQGHDQWHELLLQLKQLAKVFEPSSPDYSPTSPPPEQI